MEQTKKRKPMTPEQRERWNAYQRRYRQQHKDRVAVWRDAATLRRAARLLELRGGEADAGGD